ncbi:glycosyl hydrolase family 28-related protein [Tichowtungia aerotolerans]|uniref:Rhamnogalacturonase A/B/Epimerase-like pectate lyase domain-containing protein n=1 Tax=Tichowtungia aerotolerans TaxID=2697043 RepID=A0A6P1MAB2_9BACT|nr:glycosyl hydrolase family 28-related protein [Tichowtungia aerotolerans]QHI70771.1 hypothetical protein GT409_15425 [Tichowtungia aerotolerans]
MTLKSVLPVLFAVICLSARADFLSLNVTDYGATPVGGDDDAAAFQAAFDDLYAAGGGKLFIPAGSYCFNSRVEITGNNTSGARKITVQGEEGVRLFGNNSNGVFRFTYNTRHQQVNISDLSIIALIDDAGTAIEITSPPGGAQDKRVVTIENVSVRGQIEDSQYFNRGLVVTGLYRPLIKNCSISRSTVPDMSNTSSNFLPEVGIDVSDCYAPVIQGCTVKGAYTAYRYSTTDGSSPEDGAVMESVADYCRIGIMFHQNNDGVEPTFWVTDCDIQARDIGVWVKGRRICHITDNHLRQLSISHPVYDVQFDRVHLGFVLRNVFHGALTSARKNVVIDEMGSTIIIKENTLSGPSAEALQINAAAENILTQ